MNEEMTRLERQLDQIMIKQLHLKKKVNLKETEDKKDKKTKKNKYYL